MRYLTYLFLFFTLSVNAQTDLKFDVRAIDAEDKWVALPMNKDSTYMYGFVYLDNSAGLTFHLEGSYKISNDGKILLKKQPTTEIFKQRLTPKYVSVAIIPEFMFNDLKVKQIPEWLKIYKETGNESNRMFMLGVTHNAWNESEKALDYLIKVAEINSKQIGLNYELAFAYNALKQYDKAIIILNEALKTDSKNCQLYKELLYAQMNLKDIDKAMESSKAALEVCSDKNFRYQMLRDLLYYYFTKKDKEQFKVWADKAKVEMATVPGALQGIAKWEAEINK